MNVNVEPYDELMFSMEKYPEKKDKGRSIGQGEGGGIP